MCNVEVSSTQNEKPSYRPFEQVIQCNSCVECGYNGNKYVLVAANCFTKWVEVYAIPNQEALTVATKLVLSFLSPRTAARLEV